MDNSMLRKLQLVQLEIAEEIKRVCDENNIEYFLDFGTLLGAVRHGGFIPWDDDLDIGMLRDEYEKFLKIAPEKLPPGYFLQTWENDKNYPLTFAKVRKLETLLLQAAYENVDMHNEIWVDIFPYDSVPDNKIKLKIYKLKKRIYFAVIQAKCRTIAWNLIEPMCKKIWVFIKHIPFYFWAGLCSKKTLITQYENMLKKYNGLNTLNVATAQDDLTVPKKCFEQLSKVMFEGVAFSAPEDSDFYLKLVYGDYMVLPPENERYKGHGIIKIKF